MRRPPPPRLTSFRTALGSRPLLQPPTQLASHSLVLLLALPFLPTATAHAAEPPPATTSPLRTTVAPSIDDAALFPQWLEDRNPGLAQALDLPGHTQWIAIDIDGATYDYQVTVTAFRDGTPLGPPAVALPCECNNEALLARIDHEIEGAVERLRMTPLATDAPSAPTQPPRAPTLTAAPPARRQWTLSSLGIAGVATGAFGLIAIGAGTSLLVAGERPIINWSKLDRDFRPLGYATLATGVAALAAGVAMAVFDGMRLRRKHWSAARRAPRARATRTAPQLMATPLFSRRTTGAIVNEEH